MMPWGSWDGSCSKITQVIHLVKLTSRVMHSGLKNDAPTSKMHTVALPAMSLTEKLLPSTTLGRRLSYTRVARVK